MIFKGPSIKQITPYFLECESQALKTHYFEKYLGRLDEVKLLSNTLKFLTNMPDMMRLFL